MGIGNFVHDLRLASRKQPYPLEKPIVLQLPINDICNAACQMCNIWHQKHDGEISPEELVLALRSELFSNVRTVGLDGGEPTLRPDLEKVGDALFTALPRLRRIALITNALDTRTVLSGIDDLATATHRHGGILDVMISLDGIGEIHDRVRGKPGNFAAATEVLDCMRTHPWVDSVSMACTVVRDNVFHIHDLLEFAVDRDVPIKFRLGIPNGGSTPRTLRSPSRSRSTSATTSQPSSIVWHATTKRRIFKNCSTSPSSVSSCTTHREWPAVTGNTAGRR